VGSKKPWLLWGPALAVKPLEKINANENTDTLQKM
jgi:hypothetical protein